MSKIILGSASPRRREILERVFGAVEVQTAHAEEIIPLNASHDQIPLILSQKKAQEIASNNSLNHKILITADTLVFLNDQILGKPKDLLDACQMLSKLSNSTHEVITGVTIWYNDYKESFIDRSKVSFNTLSQGDIDYYIHHHDVLDKAGAYGIQDFIGMIGIEKIEGSYYNIMGLPIHKVYPIVKSLI